MFASEVGTDCFGGMSIGQVSTNGRPSSSSPRKPHTFRYPFT